MWLIFEKHEFAVSHEIYMADVGAPVSSWGVEVVRYQLFELPADQKIHLALDGFFNQ